MSEYEQQRYIANELDRRECELKEKRRYVPIILGDEDDRKKAGVGLVLGGTAAAMIEFGLAYYCFAEIFHLGLWTSVGGALVLAFTLPLGFKMILDHHYSNAQNASAAVLHAKHGD